MRLGSIVRLVEWLAGVEGRRFCWLWGARVFSRLLVRSACSVEGSLGQVLKFSIVLVLGRDRVSRLLQCLVR